MTDPYDLNFVIRLEPAPSLPDQRLRDAAAWVLDHHDAAPDTGLSIVITDDNEIRQLNRQYRGIDAPTDVLSFQSEADDLDEEAGPYLGDLILSLPYIQRHAESEGHSVEDELVLAVIHGTLHLLGYDHDTPDHQAAMWAIQAQALAAMQVAINVPLFEFDDAESDDESGTKSA